MLLLHEFTLSWCGQHRRPVGMLSPNFHTLERTNLLWVYEGLTQYLGEVLQVRSCLTPQSELLTKLAGKFSYLMHTEGRCWRPLEDTAIASHQLRAHSPNWSPLRRSQDY
jgi:predicted metalloprotease with PDZ domain